jgi:hypothetical protein
MGFFAAALAIWAVIEVVGGSCNVQDGAIVIDADKMTCNAQDDTDPGGLFVIHGQGSADVTITNSVVAITMRDASTSGRILISSSEVTLIFEGETHFGGIYCKSG